jgi:hypothetical protein
MKIIIDAMGGDNAPDEIIKGALLAAEEYKIEIILTGKGEVILRSLEKMGRKELPKGIEIANANEVISMEEDPVTAIREKKDSSMSVGLAMLRDGLGDAFVSEEARRVNAEFGGETSGTWIFPRISYCPDGIYAAARLVELVSQHGRLSAAIDALPRYPLKRGGIKFTQGMDKQAIMHNIKSQLDDTGYTDMNTLDGLRVSYAEGWALVRPSGTEPKIRITAEAENKEAVERLYSRAESIVMRSIESCKQ